MNAKAKRWVFCFLAVIAAGPVPAAVPVTERAVLNALYTQTNGASWFVNGGWNGAAGTKCSWQGVTCDASEAHVVGIALGGNQLTGSLPAIGELASLQNFDVNSNSLSGALPLLSSLSALQTFDASQNQFSGPIPSLDGLSALTSFNTSSNSLTGSIPALTGLSTLSTFDVGDNLLTGAAPDLSSLATLLRFRVGGNQLTGSAPTPPNPNSLRDAASSLCPNFLGPLSTPESATDLIWDDATDNTPWTEGCQSMTIAPVAVIEPAPLLNTGRMAILIGSIALLTCRRRLSVGFLRR